MPSAPSNVEECIQQLSLQVPADIQAEMKQLPEYMMFRYHMSIGLWMRNHWGLRRDSPLSNYFLRAGINIPDEMSDIILKAFWRHLHRRPIDLSGLIQDSKDLTRQEVIPVSLRCPKCGGLISWEETSTLLT